MLCGSNHYPKFQFKFENTEKMSGCKVQDGILMISMLFSKFAGPVKVERLIVNFLQLSTQSEDKYMKQDASVKLHKCLYTGTYICIFY